MMKRFKMSGDCFFCEAIRAVCALGPVCAEGVARAGDLALARLPKAFTAAYPDAETLIVTPDSLTDLLSR